MWKRLAQHKGLCTQGSRHTRVVVTFPPHVNEDARERPPTKLSPTLTLPRLSLFATGVFGHRPPHHPAEAPAAGGPRGAGAGGARLGGPAAGVGGRGGAAAMRVEGRRGRPCLGGAPVPHVRSQGGGLVCFSGEM